MAIPKRIKIEEGAWGQRHYHTSFPISEGNVAKFEYPLDPENVETNGSLKRIGEAAAGLVRSVFEVGGVTAITISPYQLTVRKTPAVTWREVEPHILKLIKKAFGPRTLQVFGVDEEVGPTRRRKLEGG